MSALETWSFGRLLQWTTDYLKEHGSDSPRLDAEVLLSSARGCQRIDLYTSFNDEAPAAVREAFRELVRRRAEGTPVAYLVGAREFYSLSFRVTPDVLIPRPETELLVMRLLELIKQRRASTPAITVADVGTGSGVIAIATAHHAPDVRFTAIDMSPAALEVARDNARRLGVADRIELVNSDLFAAVPAERRFDFVASNPPYVSTEEMATLAREVKQFEPALALEAGSSGTDVIARLIPQAAARLLAGGSLLIEISPMIEQRVLDLLRAEPRLAPGPTVKDLAGQPRVVQAQRVSDE